MGCSPWDQGSSPGPRPAARGRASTSLHDPILSFAYFPDRPRTTPVSKQLRPIWHPDPAAASRYAPCHGDPDTGLRPACRDRGPAPRQAASRGHPGHRRRDRVRHHRARHRRAAERERRGPQCRAVPHRPAVRLASRPAAGRMRAAARPAGTGAEGQPGARFRLGGRRRGPARRGDQHGRAAVHHPARPRQQHGGLRVRHLRRARGRGDAEGPHPDHPALAAAAGTGRAHRRDHLRGDGGARLRDDGEHRVLHQCPGPP